MQGCLVCGNRRVDLHHFPKTKAAGGTSTVPLCRVHHDAAHWGDERVTQTCIDKAPEWWRQQGTWEEARVAYWKYLDRRAYRDIVYG
jgi:hypothetical protein